MNIRRKRLFERCELAVDVLGERDSTLSRLLGDGDDDGGLRPDRSCAQKRQTSALFHCGDVGERYDSVFIGTTACPSSSVSPVLSSALTIYSLPYS